MKRNKHSLSHYRLITADMGKLIPVGLFEVLPGDTVQQATSMLLRCSPLMAPVMHPVTVRVHHWFVPNRLLWDGWEDFITGGADGTGSDAGPYPSATVVPEAGSLGDYFGLKPGMQVDACLMPFRAYNMIWNEFYRDQDLQEERLPDSPVLASVAWEKDYFTSARPWPQKGVDVSLPLGVTAPVGPTGDAIPTFSYRGSGVAQTGSFYTQPGKSTVEVGAVSDMSQSIAWGDPKLIADLTQASAVNINELRRAFALQRYQEARARYGSRYTEYLRYLGVRSSDARLQRPEYLGGGKQTISFSEVLQTGPGSTEGSPVPGGVGQMAGHGIAAMRSRRYRRFFEEHGLVLSLMSVRPRAIYTDGMPKVFSRRTKEDFWQRELEQIGQQEVYTRELFAETDSGGTGGDQLFGYQDRYAEYKHLPSTIHAEFRDLLNYWHLGRQFSNKPALNSDFVTCNPSKRIFAEQTKHSLWCMVSNSIQARRMVRKSSSSRIM